MPRITTHVGQEDVFFDNFDSLITFIEEYIKQLSVPQIDSHGNSFIQLIGIDGNPTDDDSPYGNRLKIMKLFDKICKEYMQEYDKCTVSAFFDWQLLLFLDAIVTFKKWRGLFEYYMEQYSNQYSALMKMVADYKKQVEDGTDETIKTMKRIRKDIRKRIDELYSYLPLTKKSLNHVNRANEDTIVLNMLIGFLKEGIRFFENEEYFGSTESSYITQRMNDWYNNSVERLKQLYHSKSVLEMNP